jgi:hypothetical protein
MNQQLKKKLYMACEDYLQLRFDALKERLDDINESLASETKSSVGDKYETGRAMLHLEKEKQMMQLAILAESKKNLSSVKTDSQFLFVEQGALVKTNQGYFYIAISAGKLQIDGQEFFAITLASPIGKMLFQKRVGDRFAFRGKEYCIYEVA